VRHNRRIEPYIHGNTQRSQCPGQLVAAPLWVAFTINLGTLLRTCDAVGACLAVPATEHYKKALTQGDTLGPGRRPHVHWVRPNADQWLTHMKSQGWRLLAVERTADATPLALLELAKVPTVVLLGHERTGIPATWVELADERIAIPMLGVGTSLNVAVAGSLILYRLAGLS
jgi:tRNA G18 (ribose-2'-O)-methylase SpoU